MKQCTNNILMVRPASFAPNSETAHSNAFQQKLDYSNDALQTLALREFDQVVKQLIDNHINVYILEDSAVPQKPDAIFPNNWISMHHKGQVIIYPMMAPNRRLEQHLPWRNLLEPHFEISEIFDFSHYENDALFLEGTGSMIFDHIHHAVYASQSIRTDQNLFFKVCETLNYEANFFDAFDQNGKPFYHTNVILSIGDNIAILCDECISSANQRQLIVDKFAATKRNVVFINQRQVNAFAGNVIQLINDKEEHILVISATSWENLNEIQRKTIETTSTVLIAHVPTIEKIGGGSIRCMIAEIFLPTKLNKDC